MLPSPIDPQTASMSLPLATAEVPGATITRKFTDTFDIDQQAHRVYYADNWTAGLEVFDISTPKPKWIKTIPLGANQNGVRVAKNVNKVYVGIAGSRMAVVDIDPSSKTCDTVLQVIHTGGGVAAVDLIGYEPNSKEVYACNRGDNFITFYDATTDKAIGKIDNLKGQEDPVFNPNDGMIYVTSNTISVLFQIDAKTHKLVHTFELGSDQRPNVLCLNVRANQALLVSSNHDKPQHVIWNFKTQKIDATVTEIGNGDGGVYIPRLDKYLIGAGGHMPTPGVGIVSGTNPHFLGFVPTGRTSSWVGFDEAHDMVYVPTVIEGRAALTGFAMPKGL